MKKQRELPVFNLQGTNFVADVKKGELRQEDQPGNTIPFWQMEEYGANYKFHYDPAGRTLMLAANSAQVVTVILPQMTLLDPRGLAQRYGLPLSEVVGKLDFEILNDPGLLERRLLGELPQVDIAGLAYRIDVEARELQPIGSTAEPISFLRFEQRAADEESYLGYYHTPSRRLVDISPDITRLPKDVVALVLPNILRLDPVGLCLQQKLDERVMREMLRRFPMPRELKAKVLPLYETALPKLVYRNQQKQNNNQRPGQKP